MAYAAFVKLLHRRAPPLIPELELLLANDHKAWKDPEALARKHHVGMPYWAVAWAGGVALARYVLDNAWQFQRKRVVDFGSGSGLVALGPLLASRPDPVTRPSPSDTQHGRGPKAA